LEIAAISATPKQMQQFVFGHILTLQSVNDSLAALIPMCWQNK
jgi:hypothetical protein